MRAGRLSQDHTVYVSDGVRQSLSGGLVQLYEVGKRRFVVFEAAKFQREWEVLSDGPEAARAISEYQQYLKELPLLRAEELRKRGAEQRAAERVTNVAIALSNRAWRKQEKARVEVELRERSRRYERFAVFSRNHESYLQKAARIAARHPDRLITFRSRLVWVTAAEALRWNSPRPIYFGLVDGGGRVEYSALLHRVILRPRPGSKSTQEALAMCLKGRSGTRHEGLWEEEGRRRVKTLYIVSNCRRISRPFPIGHLVKVSDGKPIDDTYRYSYALVRIPKKPPTARSGKRRLRKAN